MDCIAIIPARGGSKGIPRKNLQPVAGVPLVVRAIRVGLNAKRVTRTVVSTDDDEIAAVSQAAGAEVIMRPEDLSDDVIMPDLAVIHALQKLREKDGYEPELTCFMQCTSPLTTPEDIDGGIEMLRKCAADCVFAVTPSHHFLWREGSDGVAVAINHDPGQRKARQEIELQFAETGAFYIMRSAGFIAARHRFFGRVAMFPMPPERSIDIDDPMDLERANRMVQHCRHHPLQGS